MAMIKDSSKEQLLEEQAFLETLRSSIERLASPHDRLEAVRRAVRERMAALQARILVAERGRPIESPSRRTPLAANTDQGTVSEPGPQLVAGSVAMRHIEEAVR